MSNGIEVARYSFLPWLRAGSAANITTADDFGSGASAQGERATNLYDVLLNASAISRSVQLFGPGDVTGLDPRAIVRVNPGPRVMDFETNYMAFVDFYEEDLPWRYTPAAPVGQRLRPWLALVVLADGEFETSTAAGALLPAIVVSDAVLLPPAEELWAWAHVHANEDLKPAEGDTDEDARGLLRSILASTPDAAGSRILAPRRLRPNTGYHAFLVPTFETGRLTGLGQEIPAGADGLAAAWSAGAVTLPTYYSWRFRTGERGDFEHLVRLLVPRIIDPRVGIRDMDVQEPGFGLPGAGPPVLGLEGALRTHTTESTPWPDPTAFQDRVTEVVNLAEDLLDVDGPDDPTVTLPLYGRWHGLAPRLGQPTTPDWVQQVNLDPRTRAAAGLGTRVVQAFQETYMADAWEQVGEVLRANALLDRARLSQRVSQTLFTRNVEALTLSNLLSLTAPVHTRVLGSPTTIDWQLRHSRATAALLDPAFRRAVRPGGPLRKRAQGAAGRSPDRLLERVNTGDVTAAPPKRAGTGQRALDRDRDGLRPATTLARLLAWLGRHPLVLILFILLMLVLAVVLALAGFVPLAVAAGIVAIAGAVIAPRAGREAEAAGAMELLDEERLDVATVEAIPPRPGFVLTTFGESVGGSGGGRGGVSTDSPQAARFRAAAGGLHSMFEAAPEPPPEPPALELDVVRTKLLAAVEPARAVPRLIRAKLDFTARLPGMTLPTVEKIEPIMAAPDLPYPMYKELEKISSELLVPNLGLIERNTISLLEVNQPFIESYMLGLNHEMARELLWREYPTDQRGSYFRQFWDVADTDVPKEGLTPEEAEDRLRDIPPIHTWARTSDLGDHNHRLPPGDNRARLVLVIRGDLLNRYPTAVVTAAPALWPEGATPDDDRAPDYDSEIAPLFRARVGEDITFFGFDLTAQEVDGTRDPAANDPGWFFIIRERPGEPRFGLDVAESAATAVATTWNDVGWGHVGSAASFDALENIRVADGLHHVSVAAEDNPEGAQWGTHAGDMAHILYQVPVLVAVHADRMLPAET